ncbi:MAG: tetratricopeptide repeat protein [Polyangiales bacterium]
MRRDMYVAGVLTLGFLLLGCKKRDEQVIADEPSQSQSPSSAKAAVYVGTERCAACHQEEYEKWKGSDHDLAMQEATPESVLGDFSGIDLRYFGETVRFLREGDTFAIEALGADGKRRRFPVIYTFGVRPLQQYLVEVEPGRLQAFPFAWDTRSKEEGGQRWFHLQPGEHIAPGDALHWTGPSYNWNYSCADCHSTAIKKNYDRAHKRYATEYFEIDVGCEACHGPGSHHVALAEAESDALPKGAGFNRNLATPAQRHWSFAGGKSIAALTGAQPTDELETCAPCHSRRADLGGDGLSYHDRYRLSLLDEVLYFDDGQIKDEVYVYGSFVQSKMYAAGVVCSDCHDVHRTGLRAQGNALCTRCHRADVFDGPQHHFHQQGTPGSFCTDCHMPQRTYMVIDERADHRFGVPRPLVAQAIGAPDPCTSCHENKSARWADREIAKHFETRAVDRFAEAMHAARQQEPQGEPALVELVAAGTAPAIVRATALMELRNLASPALPTMLLRASNDPSPLIRRTVAVAARDLSAAERAEIVRPLLRDPVRTVRIDAVATLLGTDASGWSAKDHAALKSATVEYVEARAYNADRGDGLVDLAYVATLAGDVEHAEEDLREALDIDPTFTAAYVNLADLYRSQGRDEDAETLLRRGLDEAADRASMEFALGLTLVRLERHADALVHLRRAHELRPDAIRFGYVYAVAQYDQGRREAALRTLEELLRRYPANRDVLRLLVGYNRQMGRGAAADRYAAVLEKLGENR